MNELQGVSIKVKNFKCFGEPEQGFDQIKPINLIIGRNNSGKSTLLELLYYVVNNSPHVKETEKREEKTTEIILEAPFTEDEIIEVSPKDKNKYTERELPWKFGKRLISTKLKWQLLGNGKNDLFISMECPEILNAVGNAKIAENITHELAYAKKNPFMGKEFKPIHAERDIQSEVDSRNLNVLPNGVGATNIIQNFLNNAQFRSELVERGILEELNSIFKPDAHFTRIVVQRVNEDKWEIFLEEKIKGRVPISESGSGLKTIILVLVYLNLIPKSDKKELIEYIFAFEELENNLHPALLRRLLNYLYEKYKEHGCIFFLTTHSSVAIDFFRKNKDAQIVHVTHNGDSAKCRTVTTYIENKGILDDLDVRASDLLQSNGVIWVEGPTDRIYVNKWIELWSDGKFQEGFDYQCVFYGGRLLSHLSADDPWDDQDGIAILNINRNSIFLIDSDKKKPRSRLNETKRRIIEEIEDNHGIAWVTKGKEIENYIPKEVVAKLLNKPKVEQVAQYENFFEYLEKISKGSPPYKSPDKVRLAEDVSQHLKKENISAVLDLEQRLDSICEKIKEWNK